MSTLSLHRHHPHPYCCLRTGDWTIEQANAKTILTDYWALLHLEQRSLPSRFATDDDVSSLHAIV